MAPDVHKFSAYYDDDLEAAMRTETRLFFRQLLNTNGTDRSISRLATTALVNRELARLYGIDVAQLRPPSWESRSRGCRRTT